MNNDIAIVLEGLARSRHYHFRERETRIGDGRAVWVGLAHAAVDAGFALENSTPGPAQGGELDGQRP